MCIFDLLTRKGIGWRVYESPPSVAMLRLFAPYATDDTNIVPLARLQQDVHQGNLPRTMTTRPRTCTTGSWKVEFHDLSGMVARLLGREPANGELRSSSGLRSRG
jgi:hypothetical protein